MRTCLLFFLYLPVTQAAEFTVEMKNKSFSQKALKVRVGDVVSFKNQDTVNHNVFSFSELKTFDLGSYPQGQKKAITLDKPGTVEVECAIHPGMKMTIEVSK